MAGEFGRLLADPRFQNLDYQEQTKIRDQLFSQTVGAQTNFAQLDPTSKLNIYESLVHVAPAGVDPASDSFKAADKIISGIRQGSTQASQDAVNFLSWRQGSQAMLLPTVITQAADAIGQLFDPYNKDPIYEDLYGKSGQKINQWVMQNLQLKGMQGYAETASGQTTGIGAVGNIAEFLIAAIPLIGQVSAPGLLTKGLFGATKAWAAESAAPNFIRALGVIGTESLANTSVGVVKDFARDGLQGNLTDPSQAEFWSRMGKSFGENLAFDYLGWSAFKGVGTFAKGVLLSGKKLGWDEAIGSAVDKMTESEFNEQVVKKIFRNETYDHSTLAHLDPQDAEARVKEQILNQTRRMNSTIDLKSPEGLSVWVRDNGFSLESRTDGLWHITGIEDDTISAGFKSQSDAAQAVIDYTRTGSFSTAVPEKTVTQLAMAFDTNNKILKNLSGSANQSIPDQQTIARLLATTSNGNVVPENVRGIVRNWMMQNGVDVSKLAVHVVDDLPSSLRDPTERLAMAKNHEIWLKQPTLDPVSHTEFMSQLKSSLEAAIGEPLALAKGPNFTRMLAEIPQSQVSNGIATPGSVKYLATLAGGKYLPDGTIDINGSSVKFSTLQETQNWAIRSMWKEGQITDDQLQHMFRESTGFNLEKVQSPVVPAGKASELAAPEALSKTETRWVVKKGPDQIDAGTDLFGILDKRGLKLALPDGLAPQQLIYNPGMDTIEASRVSATGSLGKLYELSSGFKDLSKGDRRIFGSEKGFITSSSKLELNGFDVTNHQFGITEHFPTLEKARKFLDTAQTDRDALEYAAAKKGMSITSIGKGELAVYDKFGKSETFRTMDQLQKYIASIPEPEYVREIMGPVSQVGVKNLSADIESKIASDIKLFKKQPGFTGPLQAMIAPTETTLATFAKITGDWAPMTAYRRWQAARVQLNSANNQQNRVLQALAGKLDRKKQIAFGVIGQRPQAEWEKFAAEVFPDIKFQESDFKVMRLYSSALHELGSTSGLDAERMIFDYMPRVRKSALALAQDGLQQAQTGNGVELILSHAFAEGPPAEMVAFTKNLRKREWGQKELISMAYIENPFDAGRLYINALNKEKYLGDSVKFGDELLQKATKLAVEGKLDSTQYAHLKNVFDRMMGNPTTEAENMYRQLSLNFTTQLSKSVQHIPILKNLFPESKVVTDDILQKMNANLTYATQAARPFVPVRNQIQALNFAVLTDGAHAWEAFKQVNEDFAKGGKNIIKPLVDKGLISESFFDIGSENINNLKSTWQKLLRPMENTDLMGRATAFRLSELLIDDALPRLQKGIIDAQRFIKEAKLDILDQDALNRVLGHIQSGQFDAAKVFFGKQLETIAMGDFAKAAKPMMFNGVIGKVFGKFGVYPVFQMDMYRRMMTSGTLSSRMIRVAKMVGMSTAIYESFKALGIDYKGFLWSDPFEFSGGPYYTLMNDALNSFGNTAQSTSARSDLLKRLPQYLIPGLSVASRALKAVGYINNQDYDAAAIQLTTAPIRSDLIDQKLSVPWPF